MSGWLVVMHTYLYYFRLSLSHCLVSSVVEHLAAIPGSCGSGEVHHATSCAFRRPRPTPPACHRRLQRLQSHDGHGASPPTGDRRATQNHLSTQVNNEVRHMIYSTDSNLSKQASKYGVNKTPGRRNLRLFGRNCRQYMHGESCQRPQKQTHIY